MTYAADPGTGPASPQHAGHDSLLIARYASGDLGASEARTASDLVAGCAECAALAADLRVLGAAMAAPPSLPRRRDFRLTEARAAELRPPSLMARLRAWWMPQMAWLQPLAGAVAVVGLVMAVLTSGAGLPGPGGSSTGGRAPLAAAGSATPQSVAGAAAAAPSASPAAPALGAAPAPSAASAEASAAPAAIAAAPASPPPTPPADLVGAASSPRAGTPSASAVAPGTAPPAATASTVPEAVLARPAGPTSAAGEQPGVSAPRGSTPASPQTPVWALWLALGVVGGAVFVGLRRSAGRRGA